MRLMFQSQVAILFGGYLSAKTVDIRLYKFQSQVAILFGGYRRELVQANTYNPVSIAGGDSFWGLHSGVTDIAVIDHVSIAGGDSFWGLPIYRVSKLAISTRFNRRWRFFLGATIAQLDNPGRDYTFQSQVAILFGGYTT